MVSLKNANKRRPQLFNLPCKPYCSDGECRCTPTQMRTVVHNRQTGARGYRTVEKRICASIYFAPGEAKKALPDTVLLVPEIAAAIARGELVRL